MSFDTSSLEIGSVRRLVIAASRVITSLVVRLLSVVFSGMPFLSQSIATPAASSRSILPEDFAVKDSPVLGLKRRA